MYDWSGRWLWHGIRKGGRERGTAEVYSERMTSVERGNRHVEELRVTHGNTCGWFIECWNVCNKCVSRTVNIQTSECFSDNTKSYVSFGWACGPFGRSRVTVEVRIF
jgi:hypothetical protein